jgi:hypothetical protein
MSALFLLFSSQLARPHLFCPFKCVEIRFVIIYISLYLIKGEPIPEWLRNMIKKSRLMRMIFKHIEDKKKQKSKDCLCMLRSRSNSFIIKTDNDCRWFAPPYTALGSDPIYQRILSSISDIRHANQIVAERLEAEQRLKNIRREWGYVARGLDRIFLVTFVIFTLLYQTWLFSQTNIAPNKISEEFMNKTSIA